MLDMLLEPKLIIIRHLYLRRLNNETVANSNMGLPNMLILDLML